MMPEHPCTTAFLALYTEGRTRFSKVLTIVSPEDLTKKLSPL